MKDAGFNTFTSIKNNGDLEDLIAGGEAEGLHLECKAPSQPKLTKDQKSQLAEALSGFSNTAGGVIIYGMSTTAHNHSGLDIITQIEPIGDIKKFEQAVKLAIPTLTTPSIQTFQTRIIKEKTSDTKGVLVVYVPLTAHDPVQSVQDNRFYYRTGDEFKAAPYELIKRLFAAVDSPDLRAVFDSNLVKIDDSGAWNIPFFVENTSTAIAEHVDVVLEIRNPDACNVIMPMGFQDASIINFGKKTYTAHFTHGIHRGLNSWVGALMVQMAKGKRPKRRLDISISMYANKMRARTLKCELHLLKSGFKIKNEIYEDVY